MSDYEELKLSKFYTKGKFKLPSKLTEEELLLRSKFEELRRAKEKLSFYKMTGSCKSTTKNNVISKRVGQMTKVGSKSAPRNIVISKTVDLTKQSARGFEKTIDFKNWSKQARGADVKRRCLLHSFEEDSKPRSIKVQGENLTDAYLLKHLNKFGDILKIRSNESKTSSVLTFQRPSSAEQIAEDLNGSVIDGVNLKVAVLRLNTSWSTANNSSPSIPTQMKDRGKSVHLRFKGYLTASDFEDFFQKVGRITRIYLSQSKHYGFAMFENEVQAQRAIKEMNGQICNGITVNVSAQKFFDRDTSSLEPEAVSPPEERKMIIYEDLDF